MNHDHDCAKLCKNHAEFLKVFSKFLKLYIFRQVTTIEILIHVAGSRLQGQVPQQNSHQGLIDTSSIY
ncbi:MAG: hypothetical protein AMJ61_03785 [Desulfobacterales bacterium SG8_35_2]|jgi:hypothetical protein|nr:MAG: hypothetical protein AMJ61_03785 [Desulfobacterales bacterium SG8_35_2]